MAEHAVAIIESMRRIKNDHCARCICQACGACAPIPDSYYGELETDDGEGPCAPCPKCREPALTIVDATTAHAVMTVHDALKAGNQTKFAALPLLKMVDVTWKLVG